MRGSEYRVGREEWKEIFKKGSESPPEPEEEDRRFDLFQENLLYWESRADILSFMCGAEQSPTTEKDDRESFEAWKEKFKKKYGSEAEEERGFKRYREYLRTTEGGLTCNMPLLFDVCLEEYYTHEGNLYLEDYNEEEEEEEAARAFATVARAGGDAKDSVIDLTELDITYGIPEQGTIIRCSKCESYLLPPTTWVKLDALLKPQGLLNCCVKTLANPYEVDFVEAELLWEEDDYKRMAVKLTVQLDDPGWPLIQQYLGVEYDVEDQLCESCSGKRKSVEKDASKEEEIQPTAKRCQSQDQREEDVTVPMETEIEDTQ